jgi:hypothetical protein
MNASELVAKLAEAHGVRLAGVVDAHRNTAAEVRAKLSTLIAI